MALPRVLITNHPPEGHFQPLLGMAELLYGPTDGSLMSRGEVLALAPNLDAIINQAELKVDAELLDAALKLKVVANVAIGCDNLDLALMAKRGVWATNVPDAFVDSTADATLAIALALMRRLHEADRYVRSGQWVHDGFQPGIWDGIELAGKTWGIVGFGKIGRAVARRAEAFGTNVIQHTLSQRDDPRYRELDVLLQSSDIVSLHVPLTPATRGLIDAERLGKMKPRSVLVNMARGLVVVEQDLVAALMRGGLGGAGLDVFEHEPEFDPRLAEMPNVLLTPHLGGGTRESRERARVQSARNVSAVLRRERPESPVNQPAARPAAFRNAVDCF